MNTVLYPLPDDIAGFVHENCDGEYTIILNSKHSRERNRKTVLHELEHIENDDFQEANVGDIETIRHRKL